MWWKKLSAVSAAFIITSCAAAPQITTVTNEYTNDYSEISMQVLKLDIPDAPEFSESLNLKFSQEAESAAAGFDKDAAEVSEGARQGTKSVLRTTQDIKYNKNNFISVVEEQYTYTGGAHGMSLRKSRNIDTLAQQEIELKDLFSEEGYEETLNRMIREVREKHPEKYSELWEEPVIKSAHQQDFYITDSDLVIYYQPYELSYYTRGFVEFPLRLTELRGYFKDEYYRLVQE